MVIKQDSKQFIVLFFFMLIPYNSYMRLQPHLKKSYPINPGVYRMLDSEDNIIYIGKAKNLRNRLSSYFDTNNQSPRIKMMISEIRSIEVTITDSENDALVLEQKLIGKIKPRYNIIFRDDKSYPFISLSNDAFPKIFITREKTTKVIKENLFGPYPKKEDAYKNVEYIQKIFKLRTCTDNEFAHRSRPCMLHSVGKCSAPCVNKGNEQFKEEYNYNVTQTVKLLKGQIGPTITSLKEKMESYSNNLQFEQAGQVRDVIKSLNELSKKQTVYSLKEDNLLVFNYLNLDKLYLGYTRILDGVPQKVFHIEINEQHRGFSIEELLTTYIENEIVKFENLKIVAPIELSNLFYKYQFKNLSKQYKDWLNLVVDNLRIIEQEEKRIETYHQTIKTDLNETFIIPIISIDGIDISHFNGEATYGGKVRWNIDSTNNIGKFNKESYKLVRFPGSVIDDVMHINKTVDNIYDSDTSMPSILLIDGDKLQLEAAYKALKNKNITKDYILMCSAKGVTRKKGVETFSVHPSCIHFIKPQYLQEDVLILPKDSSIRLLLQNIQDNAHDYSNSARNKSMLKSRFGKKKKEPKNKINNEKKD